MKNIRQNFNIGTFQRFSSFFFFFKTSGETTTGYGTETCSDTSRKTTGKRTINGKTQWPTRYTGKMNHFFLTFNKLHLNVNFLSSLRIFSNKFV